MNEGAGSKGIERICSHRIEWWLDTGADEQITELDEVSIEHIQQCLVEGYIEGEAFAFAVPTPMRTVKCTAGGK